jgi:hypothetical protein
MQNCFVVMRLLVAVLFVQFSFSSNAQDAINYQTNFDCEHVTHLPLFLPNNWNVNIKIGLGNYCLWWCRV